MSNPSPWSVASAAAHEEVKEIIRKANESAAELGITGVAAESFLKGWLQHELISAHTKLIHAKTGGDQ